MQRTERHALAGHELADDGRQHGPADCRGP
jgi:hypothetical protein